MSISASSPDTACEGSELQQGVDTYGRALNSAGGKQLEALMRSSEGRPVCAALYTAPPYELSVPALPVCRLTVSLTTARVRGGIDGDRPRSFDTARYAVFAAPAGAAMTWRKEAPSRHLAIYFRADVFDPAEPIQSSWIGSQALLNLQVQGVRTLADELVNELADAGFHHTDAVDSLSRLMLVQVSRHLRRADASTRALDSTTLARLRDYVLAHLSERILVADLAAQAKLSLARFASAYKERTGDSPHQFVLALRLESACELLHHSTTGVADIASACGFSSQQHLTNAMHRRIGFTPRRYRELKQR